MNYSEDNSTEVSINVSKSFYLWGMYPSVQVVSVDKEFKEKGFNTVSDLRITEINTSKKILWMMLTLGMYYPQTYSLVASSK